MSISFIKALNMGKTSTPEEILNNWKKSGLLDDIREEKEMEAALALEDMAKYILFVGHFRPTIEATTTFAFPIMVRIMLNQDIYVFDSKSLFKDICDKWVKAEHVFDYKDTTKDFHAEFCSIYASKFESPQFKVRSLIEPDVKEEKKKSSVWVAGPYEFRSPGVYVREADINYVFGIDPATEVNNTGAVSLRGIRYSG